MALLDANYTKWVADRMWKNGDRLFADDLYKSNIERIALQISVKNEIVIRSAKYKGTPISLLYVHKNEFPVIPTSYFYNTLDEIDGSMMAVSDVISLVKSSPLTF